MGHVWYGIGRRSWLSMTQARLWVGGRRAAPACFDPNVWGVTSPPIFFLFSLFFFQAATPPPNHNCCLCFFVFVYRCPEALPATHSSSSGGRCVQNGRTAPLGTRASGLRVSRTARSKTASRCNLKRQTIHFVLAVTGQLDIWPALEHAV
jgi:hypothetical protein